MEDHGLRRSYTCACPVGGNVKGFSRERGTVRRVRALCELCSFTCVFSASGEQSKTMAIGGWNVIL